MDDSELRPTKKHKMKENRKFPYKKGRDIKLKGSKANNEM